MLETWAILLEPEKKPHSLPHLFGFCLTLVNLVLHFVMVCSTDVPVVVLSALRDIFAVINAMAHLTAHETKLFRSLVSRGDSSRKAATLRDRRDLYITDDVGPPSK